MFLLEHPLLLFVLVRFLYALYDAAYTGKPNTGIREIISEDTLLKAAEPEQMAALELWAGRYDLTFHLE